MHLTDIIIYPVKSLGGIHLQESIVQREGLQYDRRWMLLDGNREFITQRTVPKMALIQPEISDGYISFYSKKNNSEKIKTSIDATDGPSIPVRVWKEEVSARPVDKKVDEWFSDILGFKCELVKIEENAMRYDIRDGKGKYVSFADLQPFLIIGEKSLADLNSRLESPVPMNRFRPNFVFAGDGPHIEDTWDKYMIGEIKIKSTKPCDRCILTTVNQNTGIKDEKEPLHTLSTYRERGGKIDFGMRAKLLEGENKKVKIGDEIKILG